jgi:hypothetical protein
MSKIFEVWNFIHLRDQNPNKSEKHTVIKEKWMGFCKNGKNYQAT